MGVGCGHAARVTGVILSGVRICIHIYITHISSRVVHINNKLFLALSMSGFERNPHQSINDTIIKSLWPKYAKFNVLPPSFLGIFCGTKRQKQVKHRIIIIIIYHISLCFRPVSYLRVVLLTCSCTSFFRFIRFLPEVGNLGVGKLGSWEWDSGTPGSGDNESFFSSSFSLLEDQISST